MDKPKAGCFFLDGERMHARHPSTFEIPPKSMKDGLQAGDSVKIAVNWRQDGPGPAGERFWVHVTEINNEEIKGLIDNDLVCSDAHNLFIGDTISFRREHVLDILKGRGDGKVR